MLYAQGSDIPNYGVANAGCPDFHSPTHDRQHAWQDPVLTMTCPLTIKIAIIGDLDPMFVE
jgi:hypothetical protein